MRNNEPNGRLTIVIPDEPLDVTVDLAEQAAVLAEALLAVCGQRTRAATPGTDARFAPKGDAPPPRSRCSAPDDFRIRWREPSGRLLTNKGEHADARRARHRQAWVRASSSETRG